MAGLQTQREEAINSEFSKFIRKSLDYIDMSMGGAEEKFSKKKVFKTSFQNIVYEQLRNRMLTMDNKKIKKLGKEMVVDCMIGVKELCDIAYSDNPSLSTKIAGKIENAANEYIDGVIKQTIE
jgi:hypothetical protein